MREKFVTVVIVFILLLLGSQAFAQTATYDTVTVKELQYVANPTNTNQETSYMGKKLVVKGFVMHNPRELWVGARWACHLVDTVGVDARPWGGFFVIQDDTAKVNTLLGFVQEGDEVYFSGTLASYSGITQLNITTSPIVPVTILSSGNTLPGPKLLTAADLATHAAGEQWESHYVRLENMTVVNNEFTSNECVITDGTTTAYIDDYFMHFRAQFDNSLNAWPSNGTRLNIQGFVRDVGQDYFTINPRFDSDFEILSNPPSISNVARDIGIPTSSDDVTVTATIVDNQVVVGANLLYSVNDAAFQSLVMTANVDTFTAVIPAQANGAVVKFFLTTIDDENDFAIMPGDTSQSFYFYAVRDNGVSIKDIQYTYGMTNDASGYRGFRVTLEGVVMTDSTDWTNNYYIEEKDSAWSGIWVRDDLNKTVKGDWIRINGLVQEDYGVTRLNYITDYTVVTPSYGAFEPVKVTTGEITTGGVNAEAYESVLIEVDNVTVSNPFPDGTSGNYGEFEIDDGSGPIRVDDAMNGFFGHAQLDSTFALGETIEKVIGMHYYSFSDYKILPRDSSDIVGHFTSIDESGAPLMREFSLEQNYPNPFNSSTEIRFAVKNAGKVTVTIYNTLGQRVKMLYRGSVNPGAYTVRWNGLDEAGQAVSTGLYFYELKSDNFNATRKMLYLK